MKVPGECGGSHITTGEVTTLQHESRNDTVELRPRVAEALLSGTKGTEVFSGLGDDFVEKVEVDATGLV